MNDPFSDAFDTAQVVEGSDGILGGADVAVRSGERAILVLREFAKLVLHRPVLLAEHGRDLLVLREMHLAFLRHRRRHRSARVWIWKGGVVAGAVAMEGECLAVGELGFGVWDLGVGRNSPQIGRAHV